MTTPLNRDEIMELMARNICLEAGRMGDTEAVERNRMEADWPRHVHTALQALRALEAAGCQIVQGEPVGFVYAFGEIKDLISHKARPDLVTVGWTETPLFAGKVQP